MLAFTFLQIGTISKDSGRIILQEGGKDNIQTTTLHADKTLETNEVCFYENKVILLLDFKTMNCTSSGEQERHFSIKGKGLQDII